MPVCTEHLREVPTRQVYQHGHVLVTNTYFSACLKDLISSPYTGLTERLLVVLTVLDPAVMLAVSGARGPCSARDGADHRERF